MSAPVPPRFSLSPLSFSRLLLLFLTGLVPAVLILLSPLPFWLRVWLWIPVLGLSAALAFGRLEGRSLIGLLLSAWSFARRRRRRVWVVPRDGARREVVATAPHRPPAWMGRARRGMRRLAEAAVVYGIVTGIALAVAFGLIVAMRWTIVQVFTPADTARSVHALDEPTHPPPTPRATTAPPPPTPTPRALATASPAPTPVPRATAVAWVQERQWDILALPGFLALNNTSPWACRVQISAPGWAYSVHIPASETGKLLVVPLLQPQMAGRVLTVRSSCDLGVELVAYRPWHPQRARVWLVPVCDPPGRVRVRPHDGVAALVLHDLEGSPASASVDVPRSGAWAPQAPAGGCWLYRVESTSPVWLEVMVFAWP
jgi:hypothetical protein